MKHTYLIVACLLFGMSHVSAQKKSLAIPAHNYPEHYFETLNANTSVTPDAQAVTVRPLSAVANAASRGGVIWSEDFGGGFPAGWAIDDQSGICPWKWTMDGSHGNFNDSNGSDYDDPISSTTAANGFLIVDADSANHFTYGQPSGTTYQYLDSYFATSAIDLGAAYSSLLLEFEQSFRFNNGLDLEVQVSSDSTNWSTYNVQGGVDNNAASDDPDLVSINISGAVGAAETVYLRIGWSARVYYWMIDDMKIVQGLDNDLEFTKAYHGDIVQDYQYSKVPLEQSTEMVVGAVVTNLGGVPQTNVTVDYDILQNSVSVSTGSFSFTESIIAADSDTAWHSTGYTPDITGDYEVMMTVSSDNADENMDNQSGSSEFEVTDFVFAHDYDEDFDIQVYGQDDDNGEANPYGHGNVFIAYNGGSSIYAIEAAFGANTTAGTSIIAEVHELGSSIQDIVDTYQSVYDVLPSDVNGGSNFSFTTIVLDEEVPLNAGTNYTISLQSEGFTDELWILSNSGDEDLSTTLYGPYGTGGSVNWYNGWEHTPGIRMNINPNISSVEEMLNETGFAVYPNPAVNELTLSFEEGSEVEMISIVDVEGKTVLEHLPNQVNGTKLTLDVSSIASGVYFVNVLSQKDSRTQKIIIK